MADLNGSKTQDNLKEAFAGESQANRRYLYFAQKADIEGYPDVAALFRSVAEGETGHAFGHFDFLAEVGDPVTGVPVGPTADNLKSAIEGETYEYTEMYPGFAKTARDEGFDEIAEWLEVLARAEKSHAGRFTEGLEEGQLTRIVSATHLYDPLDPAYFDPAEARAERDRTFQICSDCRICVRFCPSFKDLFKMIDEKEDATDVSVLTDAQHEVVVDECYQCKLCYVVCPYTPANEQEWVVDFPRLMLRSLAIEERAGKVSRSAKLLARTDLQGRVATAFAPIVNRTNDVGFVRGLMEKTTGIAKDRLLPTFAKVRFSKWFRAHERGRVTAPASSRGEVALFPTCLVEYQDPGIGEAMVGVFERNGIGCSLPDGEICCGMPWLDAGDVAKFEEHAAKNVQVLAAAVKEGRDVVVPQPTCAYVLKQEYPDFLGTDDARLVASRTFDTSEYLMARNKEEPLDTDFSAGETYETITWHAACHYRAQQIGPKSRDLMALSGAKVTMVERCSAIDGTWGLRAENVEMARKIAQPLMDAVKKADTDLVAGDCHLANTAITEGTGKTPVHPLQVLARAYGIK